MKIQGKLQGDMIGFSLKHNPENGVRVANVKIAVRADRDRCERLFGEALARLAFGSMSKPGPESEEIVSFGYKKLEPSEICEFHNIKIAGKSIDAQPVIKSIVPVKDESTVTIVVETPILIGADKELAGALCAEFGEVIEMEFEPAQRELPLGGDNAQGSVTVLKGSFGNPQTMQV